MKLISKPIRKGSATEPKTITGAACIASVLLTGAVALTATGCDAQIKADGVTVENLIVNGSEYEGVISDALSNTGNMMVTGNAGEAAPGGRSTTDNAGSSDSSTSRVNERNTGNQGRNTTAPAADAKNNGKTVDQNGNTVNGNNTGRNSTYKATSFADIPDGTVYEFVLDDYGILDLKKDFGQIIFSANGSNIEYGIDGYFYTAEITSTNWNGAWLIRNNGKTYIYVETQAYDYLNVYEITERSIKYLGSDRLLISNPTMNNTKSFKCYEYNGYGGETDVISFERNYKVSDNGMPVPADNYSSLGAWVDVMASYDMTGYVVKDGNVTSDQRTIKAGDSVEPVKLNEVEYIDFVISSGETVRVDFTQKCCDYYDMNDNRWAYKAVMSMVELKSDKYAYTIDNFYDNTVLRSNEVTDGTAFLSGSFGRIDVKTYGDKDLKITYHGDSYVVDVKTDWTGNRIGAFYLLKMNGKAFIYVPSFCEADQHYINVYSVSDSNIVYVGSARLSLDEFIMDPNCFLCREYGELNGMISISRYYKVSDNGMPVICDYMCYVDTFVTLKAAHDITGYIVKNGNVTSEQRIIKAGDIVTPLELNEVDHIDFLDANGNIIRVDFVDELNRYYDMYDNNWVYEGVLSMVEYCG